MPDAEIEKTPKTPEELAAIAYLDKLRTCEGEAMPAGLPLACFVKVVAYEEIPKACEQYAMATVEGATGGHGGCAFAAITSKRGCWHCSFRMMRFCPRMTSGLTIFGFKWPDKTLRVEF